MRIHNLYTDAAGQSHFRDLEIEWVEERRGSKLSKRLAASGIIFRETQAEHDIGWRTAPRRQYIINLDAGVKITASDGEARVIGAGEGKPNAFSVPVGGSRNEEPRSRRERKPAAASQRRRHRSESCSIPAG